MRIEFVGGHLDGDVLTLPEKDCGSRLRFSHGEHVAVYEVRITAGRTRTGKIGVYVGDEDRQEASK